jgi:hypothetical protein
MIEFSVINIIVAVLFALMALRAFRSGSALDYLLAASQSVGVIMLFSAYRELASGLLLLTAVGYLVSQMLTGARPLSRLLPVVGALSIVLSFMM